MDFVSNAREHLKMVHCLVVKVLAPPVCSNTILNTGGQEELENVMLAKELGEYK